VVVLGRNLTVSYGASPVLAVDSVQVSAGQSLCVTGRNGSGKSTLLRLICGIAEPTSGKLTVFGMVPNDRSSQFRQKVAGLLSTPPMAPDLTLIEHLALLGTSWGMKSEPAKVHGAQWLNRFDINYVANSFPNEISAGERQAFALVMVLARPSKLLVLDEPERHLDTDRISLLANELSAYRRAGGTVIVATHSAQLKDSLVSDMLELQRQ